MNADRRSPFERAIAGTGVPLQVVSFANQPQVEHVSPAILEFQLRESRKLVVELVVALRGMTDFYANDCRCKLSSGFTCIVHRNTARLARIIRGEDAP